MRIEFSRVWIAGILALALLGAAILLGVGRASASGEYAYAYVNTSGTNFFGSCLEVPGDTGWIAWSLFFDNGSYVDGEQYTFTDTNDVHQWQNGAGGYYPGHTLQTVCVV